MKEICNRVFGNSNLDSVFDIWRIWFKLSLYIRDISSELYVRIDDLFKFKYVLMNLIRYSVVVNYSNF